MRRMGSRVFLLAVLWLAASAWSPAQIALSNSSGTETYKLQGEVVNSITGEGIPYVLVTVSSENKQALLTGTDGHFEFAGLRAGRVTVTASKPGFFEDGEQKISNTNKPGRIFVSDRSNGRYAMKGLGVSIEIGPDTVPVTFKLMPEGIITGHIEDSGGEPIERAFIRVEAIVISDGRKLWTQMAGITSREDGTFRIANLHPGRYYVSVHSLTRGRTLEDVNAANPVGYPLSVYYPAAPDRASAAPIDIAAGQRVEIQFALKLQPVFKVSGNVSGQSNVQSVNIRLLSSTGEDLGLPGRFYPADGRFEIQGVPAGNYRLEARGDNRGELPLHVSGTLNGVHVVLRPKTSIPVIIRNEATRAPEMKLENFGPHHGIPISLMAHRSDLEHDFTSTGLEQHSDDGPPALNVEPGKYAVDLSVLYGGVYVQSARYGDIDLLREELIVQPAAPRPIEVVLRDDGANLQIKIAGAERNATSSVVVVPEAAPNQLKVAHVGGDGEGGFVMGFINGLAPGDYKVFAFDSIETMEFRNPEVLKQYNAKAAQVSLTSGMSSNVSVELIHTSQ